MNANKNTSFTTSSILRIFGIKNILSLSSLLSLSDIPTIVSQEWVKYSYVLAIKWPIIERGLS